jgi:DNA-binding SARP family transcriptional activator
MFREVRFEVLGPVRGWAGEAELELGSPQQRAILAMLLLARGRQVSLGNLVDGLWAEDVPRAAVGTVRTYVSRLRRRLGKATGRQAEEVIESVGDGYGLSPSAAPLDLEQFEDRLSDARAAVDGEQSTHAVRLLGDALGLWRGVALAGIPGPYAESRRVRLTELHMVATEEKLSHEVSLGLHAVAIPELRSLLAEHPFRERLAELLMLGLYRSGRQAEALAVFTAVRERLSADLGIDPGPALQAMHQRILRADSALMDAATTEPARVGASRRERLKDRLGQPGDLVPQPR